MRLWGIVVVAVCTVATQTCVQQRHVAAAAIQPGTNGLGVVLRDLSVKHIALHLYDTNQFLISCRAFFAGQLDVANAEVVFGQLRPFSDKSALLTIVITRGDKENTLPTKYGSLEALKERWSAIWNQPYIHKRTPKFGHRKIEFEALESEVSAVLVDVGPPTELPYWASSRKAARVQPQVEMRLKLKDDEMDPSSDIFKQSTQTYREYGNVRETLQKLVAEILGVVTTAVYLLKMQTGSLLLAFTVFPVPSSSNLDALQALWFDRNKSTVLSRFPNADVYYPPLVDSRSDIPVEPRASGGGAGTGDKTGGGGTEGVSTTPVPSDEEVVSTTGILVGAIVGSVVFVLLIVSVASLSMYIYRKRRAAVMGQRLSDGNHDPSIVDTPTNRGLSSVSRSPRGKARGGHYDIGDASPTDSASGTTLHDVSVEEERTPLASQFEKS